MPKMLPSLLRNVAARPATRRYPASVREPFAHARGEIANDPEVCIFCGICMRKCPSQCITVDKDAAVWEWHPFECVYCGVCADVCPTKSLTQKETRRGVAVDREIVRVKGEPKPKK